MKKKILNIFLGIVLVLAIAFFIFVIYVKFFYEQDTSNNDKNSASEINTKELKSISEKITDSNIAKYYFKDRIFTSSSDSKSITIKVDTNELVIPYKNDILTLKSDDNFKKEDIIYILQILVDSIGRNNGYQEGEFINLVNALIDNRIVPGITYMEEDDSLEVNINIKNKLEPLTNERLIEQSKNYEIVYIPWKLLDATKGNYAILLGDNLIYDIKFEHNSVYNILKFSFKMEFLGIINDTNKESYRITTKIYDNTNTLISESFKDYSVEDAKINNIRISHLLKNKNDYTNVEYISFELE